MTNQTLRGRLLASSSALRVFAAIGAGAAATTMIAAPAHAQVDCTANPGDPSCTGNINENNNVIVVTGSIVRNPAAATASPVVSISSDELDARGISSVADALQQLTANNAGTAQPSWSSFGFATGASAISLRGLNDAYTLTLFNGLRSAFYPLGDDGSRNFVDANSIPQEITDHIDVLLDGASATYGSDAVAGVVNIVVKREIQGLHMNASYGQAMQHNDSREYRVSATYGYGDLYDQGFNIFINGMYQKNDGLFMNQRSTGHDLYYGDLSSICGTADQGCLYNSVRNGIQYDGSYGGFQSTAVPFVRPYDPNSFSSLGPYEMLNPSAGCGNLASHTLTADEKASYEAAAQLPAGGAATILPDTVCQQDISDYLQYNSPTERYGANLKATFQVGANAEAYFMFNYYKTKQQTQVWPSGMVGNTPPPAELDAYIIMLPAYVCPTGSGTIVGGYILVAQGCDANNGTLNTANNPYAASGNWARLQLFNPLPQETDTDATTTRFSAGINGSFGSWNYNLNAVTSQVKLNRTFTGVPYVKGLMDAIAQGTFNFSDFYSNSQAAFDQVFPADHNLSRSETTQVVVSLDRDFFDLPGGALNIAVSGQYRYEAVHNPSANPPNYNDMTQQWFSINSVGVDGSRHVWSAAYEISAPITDMLRVKLDGSYDSYSSGQSHFSPKFEAEFKPIEQLKLRGTYSKGFRVPSFSQAYALFPTTGYTTAQINCSTALFQSFCAAHASNPGYYSGGYQVGLTSDADPGLSPEKSESFTLGAVFEPVHHIIFTADYWQTKISDVIVPVSLTQEIINQYYGNNGVVTVPGVTVTPATVDTLNPNALPILGYVEAPYQNASSLLARGIDFSGSTKVRLSDALNWNSQFNASLLLKLQQNNQDGTVWRFDGSLGACNITSCSGAPRWRLTWQNTLDFNDKASFTLTAYYTSSYSEVATDSGGTYGDCAASAEAGQIITWDNGDPVRCRGQATFDLDGHIEYKFMGHFTLYGDVRNILNTAPEYDPNPAYGLYGFNPSWQDKLFIGRWFRVGVKVDY